MFECTYPKISSRHKKPIVRLLGGGAEGGDYSCSDSGSGEGSGSGSGSGSDEEESEEESEEEDKPAPEDAPRKSQ